MDTADERETLDLTVAWRAFQRELASYLASMGGDDALVLELPGDAGPRVRFRAVGPDRLRAEISGAGPLEALTAIGWSAPDGARWSVERSIRGAGPLARETAGILRDLLGIVHPRLLSHRAGGPAAQRAHRLGLAETGGVPLDGAAGPLGPVVELPPLVTPQARDELCAAVATVLARAGAGEPVIDDDGDFVLSRGSQPVWIRVHEDQPAVQIMARVACGVRSRRAAAVEIGLLNRDNLWVKWTMRDRDVWQTVLLPGMPFVPGHLEALLELFMEALEHTRDDLAYRTGAQTG